LRLERGLADRDIFDLAAELDLPMVSGAGRDAVAIDAPFGWPQPFIQFVNRSPKGIREVPDRNPAECKRLTFRLTDLYVQQTLDLWPLVVTAGKIALPAMRCSGLLDNLGVRDCSGVNGVFEVYPAAALKAWGLPYKGYKSEGPNPVRADLVGKVSDACSWPTLFDSNHALCARDHDAFDAVIAAFVGRAAALELTGRPEEQSVVDEQGRLVVIHELELEDDDRVDAGPATFYRCRTIALTPRWTRALFPTRHLQAGDNSRSGRRIDRARPGGAAILAGSCSAGVSPPRSHVEATSGDGSQLVRLEPVASERDGHGQS
jgi:hypothetical protein